MAGWTPTAYQPWVQTDFRDAITEEQGEQLGSNQEFLKSELDQQVSEHKNDDPVTHFRKDLVTTAVADTLLYKGGDDTPAHNEASHLMSIDVTGAGAEQDGWVKTQYGNRADRVPTRIEARVKVNAHATNKDPFIGYSSDPTVKHVASPPSDGAWFERGTNANTWKARTRSGGVDRTTTDNQAGNYVGWDNLKIEMDGTDVKFYINGTLVATHSTSVPNTAVLDGFAKMEADAAINGILDVDSFSHRATADSESP